jgi:hypothetical protein
VEEERKRYRKGKWEKKESGEGSAAQTLSTFVEILVFEEIPVFLLPNP